MVRKEYLIKTKVDFAGCTAPDFCRQLLFIVVYNTFVFHRTDFCSRNIALSSRYCEQATMDKKTDIHVKLI